jgi:hypothetical protein
MQLNYSSKKFFAVRIMYFINHFIYHRWTQIRADVMHIIHTLTGRHQGIYMRRETLIVALV